MIECDGSGSRRLRNKLKILAAGLSSTDESYEKQKGLGVMSQYCNDYEIRTRPVISLDDESSMTV